MYLTSIYSMHYARTNDKLLSIMFVNDDWSSFRFHCYQVNQDLNRYLNWAFLSVSSWVENKKIRLHRAQSIVQKVEITLKIFLHKCSKSNIIKIWPNFREKCHIKLATSILQKGIFLKIKDSFTKVNFLQGNKTKNKSRM